jgi:hypothetical protein
MRDSSIPQGAKNLAKMSDTLINKSQLYFGENIVKSMFYITSEASIMQRGLILFEETTVEKF